jgi:hypothetical protein
MIDAHHVRSPPRILLSVFLVTAPKSLRFVYLETSCLPILSKATFTKPSCWLHSSFALLFSPLFSGHASNPERSHKKGLKAMGRHPTEAAYLKSVLFWLQGHWSEPDPPRFYPLGEVEQGSWHYSARRTHAAFNRRDAIVDVPAFLPPRTRQHTDSE